MAVALVLVGTIMTAAIIGGKNNKAKAEPEPKKEVSAKSDKPKPEIAAEKGAEGGF